MPIMFTCETCGETFQRPPSVMKHDPPRFCSPECFYKWLKGSERAERIETTCGHCGKSIRVLVSRYKDGRGRFCSQECMIAKRPNPPRTVKKIKRTCLQCGKTFYRYPSQLTRPRDGKFCSGTCRALYVNQRRRLQKGPTSIEQLLIDELSARAVPFCFQYPFAGYVLDFAFPIHQLAVEADGVYWHSLENVQEKDARKDQDLADLGWTVLHFDGDEIRESPAHCVNLILAHL